MICVMCKKKITPEHSLVQLHKLVRNHHRGDFVVETGKYVHLYCVVEGAQK